MRCVLTSPQTHLVVSQCGTRTHMKGIRKKIHKISDKNEFICVILTTLDTVTEAFGRIYDMISNVRLNTFVQWPALNAIYFIDIAIKTTLV